MAEEYVKKVEYVRDITEMGILLKGLKKDFDELKRDVKDIRKKLFETNGGKSFSDTLKDHDQDIRELKLQVEKIKEQKVKTLQNWYDNFWKYLIRFTIVGTFVLLSYLIGSNSSIGEKLIKFLGGH